MTCPVDALPEFDCGHWDVYELCSLMRCPECTAGDGEGVFWDAGEPMPYTAGSGVSDDWNIPF